MLCGSDSHGLAQTGDNCLPLARRAQLCWHRISADDEWCVVCAVAAECGPPATWGQVCIAMLIQRASDKAAAVRARAISNLASIIEHWCAQKAGPMAASIGQFRQVDSWPCAVSAVY